MWVKRTLILLPIAVILFLLQSFFWVPTYENQTKGSAKRLTQYIQGSIGDASILNPILNADTASSTITGLVFEGLIDRDRDLSFRSRLAERWELFEEAYLLAVPSLSLSGGEDATAEAIVRRVETARSDPAVKWAKNIRKVEIVPPGSETRAVPAPPAKRGDKTGQRPAQNLPPRPCEVHPREGRPGILRQVAKHYREGISQERESRTFR